MRFGAAELGLCAALVLAYPPDLGAEEVARVLGVAIDSSELPAERGEAALGKLYDLVWNAVARHYVEQNRLNATQEEIAEVREYEREFNRRDRSQRARKLLELDRRLANPDLPAAERASLEEFRATLARLAQDDPGDERVPAPDPEGQSARRAQWIEMWKMNRALYEQYGGVVALTRFGPFPHGARAALLEDYERRGLLQFSDRERRERLFAPLLARPPATLDPGQVDFTPYWKRPIPPSYFPD
jgi:hypothetical protein